MSNQNSPSAIKFSVNIRAINQETYLIKGSLYSMRETVSSLCSDVTAGTQSEKDMQQVFDLHKDLCNKIDELNKLVELIKAKGDYNEAGYFKK